MRFRKIISVIAAAAVTASCAAGMFVFDAGAYNSQQYIYPVAYGQDSSGKDLYGPISVYAGAGGVFNPANITVTMPSSVTPSTPSEEVLYTGLTKADLEIVRSYALSLNYSITDTYNNYYGSSDTVRYSTKVSFENFYQTNADGTVTGIPVPDTGINPVLIFSTGSAGKSFTVRNNGNLGQVTLKYRIDWENFEKLKSSYGLASVNDVYYKYKDESGIDVVRIIKAGTDANFELTGSRTLTFYYDENESFFAQKDADKVIKEKILLALGYTEEEIKKADNGSIDDVIRSYVDNTVTTQIKDTVFTKNADGTYSSNYITTTDVENAVENYFNGQNKSANLAALSSALLNTATSSAMIDKAVYDTFGYDLSDKVKTELVSAIWQPLVEKAVTELTKTGIRASEFRTLVTYFMNDWTQQELDSLKSQINKVQSTSAFSGKSLGEILKTINDLTDALIAKDPEYDMSVTELLNMINTTGRLTVKEYGTTVVYDANRIPEIIAGSAYAGTGSVETSLAGYSYYTNTQDIALQNQTYSYDVNSLNQQIDALRNEINILRSQVNNLQTSQTETFNDWAVRNYGSVDGFLTAVSNDVAKRIGSSTGSGESAYEIAVRNGFAQFAGRPVRLRDRGRERLQRNRDRMARIPQRQGRRRRQSYIRLRRPAQQRRSRCKRHVQRCSRCKRQR